MSNLIQRLDELQVIKKPTQCKVCRLKDTDEPGLLRAVHDTVKRGIPQAQIVRELQAAGLDISANSMNKHFRDGHKVSGK